MKDDCRMSRDKIVEELVNRTEQSASGRQAEFEVGKKVSKKLVAEFVEYKELLEKQDVTMNITDQSESEYSEELDLNLAISVEGIDGMILYQNTPLSFNYKIYIGDTSYSIPFDECTDEYVVLIDNHSDDVKRQTYKEHADLVIQSFK